MNILTLIGNLGNAPTFGGDEETPYARFSLALTERYKLADGQRAERTDWVQVVAFGPLAKTLVQLGKGDEVAVAGKLRSNSWETKTGEKRTSIDVVAHDVKFLRRKEREAAD